jgi:hypothetical protein
VETYAPVTLDGSASRDPSGGEVTAYRWTIRSEGAACEPPTVASSDAQARIRFGCPGQYAVSLVVVNDLSMESEPLTTTVSAVPSTRPPVVTAGGDVQRSHACSGTPLRCGLTQGVPLEARTGDPSLTLRWTAEPPVGRELGPSRRVRFDPDQAAASPEVNIESDGLALSGDWIFRVEARDEFGPVGAAVTRVSVLNAPPVLAPLQARVTVPHAFDAARSVFTATGSIAYRLSDPEGDPVELMATFRHVGDGGARFSGTLDRTPTGKGSSWSDGRADFVVEVPFATADDAASLIGGEGLERTVELLARDASGAEARISVPVVIGNRPPEAVALASPTVDHSFDAAGSRYVATANLWTWGDPDGDPLEISGGAEPCPTVWLDGDVAKVECALPYDGVPDVGGLVGSHAVTVRVRDPWAEGAVPAQTVTITNRPPTLTVKLDPATVPRQFPDLGRESCLMSPPWPQCPGSLELPNSFRRTLGAVTFTVTPTVSDPDGDPIVVTPTLPWTGGSVAPLQALCAGTQCVPFRVWQAAPVGKVCPNTTLTTMTASDGAAAVTVPASPLPSDC